MKKSRYTQKKIIGVLKQMEAGRKVADLARDLGVSEATIYTWKSKYGGLEVSEARRLRELERENGELKKLESEQLAKARKQYGASNIDLQVTYTETGGSYEDNPGKGYPLVTGARSDALNLVFSNHTPSGADVPPVNSTRDN